jgi:hypothetical protein
MYCNGRKMADQETIAAIVFLERGGEQENFFYMDAACQAMVLFCSKMRFMLAYIRSPAIITANHGGAVIMKKLKRKLRCRKADKQQQRNTEAI